jgi:hypothetical protein
VETSTGFSKPLIYQSTNLLIFSINLSSKARKNLKLGLKYAGVSTWKKLFFSSHILFVLPLTIEYSAK